MKLFRRMRPEDARHRVANPSAPDDAPPERPLDAAFLLHDRAFGDCLARIDAVLTATPVELRPALFADIPSDIFALLCLHRPPIYPNLARWLPEMPDAALQTNSTGTSGQRTMLEAARFVSAAVRRYAATGRSVAEARVLDFGVCWARIARLLYQHVPTDRLFGTDAWPPNLQAARDCGFAGHLAEIEERPSELPFKDVRFDLVVAFSVFTHLSPSSSEEVLRAIRAGMSEDGLLAITLRPSAFADIVGPERRAVLAEGVNSIGFGYFPEPWSKDAVYGDAVVSLDYVRKHWTGFDLAGVEVNAADPYQLYAFLRPR